MQRGGGGGGGGVVRGGAPMIGPNREGRVLRKTSRRCNAGVEGGALVPTGELVCTQSTGRCLHRDEGVHETAGEEEGEEMGGCDGAWWGDAFAAE